MHAVELIIGDYVHQLPRNADADALLTEMTDAVHAGGGVVTLPTAWPEASVSVLISPGVPVFIERRVIEDDAAESASAAVGAEYAEWAEI